VKAYELMRRLEEVQEEHRAATAAISHVILIADRDPGLLQMREIERRALRICHENVERTYRVRLFAVIA